MERFIIHGGRRLQGRVRVHGAKNSILPILAASLLNKSKEKIILHRVPGLCDVKSMLAILTALGARVEQAGGDLVVHTDSVDCFHVPDAQMREMRSSIFLMGPLLGRLGKVRVCYPGGCAIGPRPINLHLKGLQALGAVVEEKDGYIEARGRLRGAEITLGLPSVGATENLILAAVLAAGKTVIHNAAREPEITDLQNFLNILGADVAGAGTATVTITGVDGLGGGEYTVFPDRIVAGTFLMAAAVTGGNVIVDNVVPAHLEALLRVLKEAGAEIKRGAYTLEVLGAELRAVSTVCTAPYPGFPTDLQPLLVALLALARGTSIVMENIFEYRFRHVTELRKMGADIRLEEGRAVINGVPRLAGATVRATDLRAGAALVLAGLAAGGVTEILDIHHIDRGYEDLASTLCGLGAAIERYSMAQAGKEA